MTAGVNITYKILINDAVAMTGGQPVEGHLTVAEITHQLRAERVQRIAVVSDDVTRYGSMPPLPPGSPCITDRRSMCCSANCARHRESARSSMTKLAPRKSGRRVSADDCLLPSGAC